MTPKPHPLGVLKEISLEIARSSVLTKGDALSLHRRLKDAWPPGEHFPYEMKEDEIPIQWARDLVVKTLHVLSVPNRRTQKRTEAVEA